MAKRIILLGVICTLLIAGTGCGLFYPYRAGMMCDPEHCPPGYGPMGGCGPVCGPYCDPCCDPHCGLLPCILRLFRPVCWCGRSCAEGYWGDFHGDPPDCYDPCDRCGNFTEGYDGQCYGGECCQRSVPPAYAPAMARQNGTIERAAPRVAKPRNATARYR